MNARLKAAILRIPPWVRLAVAITLAAAVVMPLIHFMPTPLWVALLLSAAVGLATGEGVRRIDAWGDDEPDPEP